MYYNFSLETVLKFKVTTLILLLIPGFFIVKKKFFSSNLNSELHTKVKEVALAKENVPADVMNSVYYILGHAFFDPIHIGKKIYNKELSYEDRDKLPKRFDDKNNVFITSKVKIIDSHFYDQFKVYLESDKYLKNNFQSLLIKSTQAFENAQKLPGVMFSFSSLAMDNFKFHRRLNRLIAYDFLSGGDVADVKKYYEGLHKLAITSEINILNKMIHLISFRDIHAFVVKYNLFETEDYIAQLQESNTSVSQQNLIKYEFAATNVFFGKVLPWSEGYEPGDLEYFEAFYNHGFLQKFPKVRKVYFFVLDQFIDHTRNYNQAYSDLMVHIKKCFPDYESCSDELIKKSLLEQLGYENPIVLKSILIKNLMKLNGHLEKINKIQE